MDVPTLEFDASCIGTDPDAWFDQRVGQFYFRLCRDCPVLEDCLNETLEVEERYGYIRRFGVFAGLTPSQRNRLTFLTPEERAEMVREMRLQNLMRPESPTGQIRKERDLQLRTHYIGAEDERTGCNRYRLLDVADEYVTSDWSEVTCRMCLFHHEGPGQRPSLRGDIGLDHGPNSVDPWR